MFTLFQYFLNITLSFPPFTQIHPGDSTLEIGLCILRIPRQDDFTICFGFFEFAQCV